MTGKPGREVAGVGEVLQWLPPWKGGLPEAGG